ncbi:hypothetical protein BGZ98_003660, partial [Dissophora globulifera]
MKTFTISCLLAAAALQTAFAQVLIAPEPDMNSTTLPETSKTTSSSGVNSVYALVDNNLEVGGAKFPFLLLPDHRIAVRSAQACEKLGETLYAAKSDSLPSVAKMLTRVAAKQTEFYIDTGASDPKYITKCDTLVIKNGVATVVKGGSCQRLLPSLCSNNNLSGKVSVDSTFGRVTGKRDKMGF